jgi:predicted HTH transcriptional regulator
MIDRLAQLAEWMGAPEDENLEFKEATNHYDFEKLVKYCCALANEGGGRIILGVSDRRPRRVVGTKFFDDLQRTKHGLVERLRLRNDVHSVRDGLFRRDIPTFNEDAVREAVLNAVSHRDYRLYGSTFVRQSPRRIEIVSPGGFPSDVRSDNILFAQSPRNRRLAEAMARCGLVERSGQGADRMFATALKEGKLPPSFDASDSSRVSVVLNGVVQDEAFITFLERVATEKGRTFQVADLVVKVLLRELKEAGRAHTRGVKRAARWFAGPGDEGS